MLYTFAPDHFFTTLGSHPPVLRVRPGDQIITATVDAAGVDASGTRVTAGPNPMSGPFFVEGAEPGDTLEVTIRRITPTGGRGWSGSALAANVVDPEAVFRLPRPRKGNAEEGQWAINLEAQRAELVAPQMALQGILLPLAPMIGCFGVAPAGGEAISTATSAQHGGNMDWRGFGPGVVARFPVFVPGALFFVGDVHARQGHGEIAGTGIEVPAEVEFALTLQKGRRIHWPHAEDDGFLCTLGNARPLDQALQHATSEMLRLLTDEMGLDDRSAQTLMGQVVEYEIANVFDPAYTIVCKMPKWALALAGH
jgi:acetamidase/formamidase